MVIVCFLMGVCLIAWGIKIISNNSDSGMDTVSNAVVVNCEDANPDIDNYIRYPFNITVEIYGSFGMVTEIIESDRILKKGAKCRVNYDIQNGEVEFATKDNGKVRGTLIAAFGALWSAFVLARTSFPIVLEPNALFGFFIVYALAYIMMAIGVNGVFVQPIMRKKEKLNYKSVSCTVVETRITRARGRNGGGAGNKLYAPIYSFYYDGDEHRLCSPVATTSKKRSRVGRRTNIFIDESNGKIYNPDDSRMVFSIVLGAMGLMFFISTLYNIGIL